jgi:predicted Zn-dependent protease with MMP-like domain
LRHNSGILADTDVKALVEAALLELPEPFKGSLDNLAVLVDDFPDEETRQRFKSNIFGLYRGVSLPRRSVRQTGVPPSIIYIYARPIVNYCARTGEDVAKVVNAVLIHEIGHHFGFNDEEIYRIEDSP